MYDGLKGIGNIVAATLENTKGNLINLIMTMRFMRSFFEVSSVATTMLPSVWFNQGVHDCYNLLHATCCTVYI